MVTINSLLIDMIFKKYPTMFKKHFTIFYRHIVSIFFVAYWPFVRRFYPEIILLQGI